jgi:hypothetical protein
MLIRDKENAVATGYAVGGGTEVAWGRHMIFFGEYLDTDFGRTLPPPCRLRNPKSQSWRVSLRPRSTLRKLPQWNLAITHGVGSAGR